MNQTNEISKGDVAKPFIMPQYNKVMFTGIKSMINNTMESKACILMEITFTNLKIEDKYA